MGSEIIFIGTSGDINLTTKGIRRSGGFVIRSNDYQIHVDPGPGAVNNGAIMGVNSSNTNFIIITHEHNLHSSDANTIITAASKKGTMPTTTLIASKTFIDKINRPFNSWYKNIFQAIPEKKISAGTIEFHPFKANHNDETAFGIKIFTPQSIIGYTGDTGYNKEIIEGLTGSDIIILNTKHSRNENNTLNLNMNDAEKIISNVKPALAILTHFGEKIHAENPLYEAREIQKNTGVQTITATDGLAITPESYSAKLKTKTLNLYD